MYGSNFYTLITYWNLYNNTQKFIDYFASDTLLSLIGLCLYISSDFCLMPIDSMINRNKSKNNYQIIALYSDVCCFQVKYNGTHCYWEANRKCTWITKFIPCSSGCCSELNDLAAACKKLFSPFLQKDSASFFQEILFLFGNKMLYRQFNINWLGKQPPLNPLISVQTYM